MAKKIKTYYESIEQKHWQKCKRYNGKKEKKNIKKVQYPSAVMLKEDCYNEYQRLMETRSGSGLKTMTFSNEKPDNKQK